MAGDEDQTPTPGEPAPATELEEVELDGLLLGAALQVQCVTCGDVLDGQIAIADPSDRLDVDDHAVECPKCSEAMSRAEGRAVRAMIPIAALAGMQVEIALPDGELPIVDGDGKEADA